MGEMSSVRQRRYAAIYGIAKMLNAHTMDYAILTLLLVQYLDTFTYESVAGKPNIGRAQVLQLYGPLSIRRYCLRLIRSRNLVAHALYTQACNQNLRKDEDVLHVVARAILEFECNLVVTVDDKQKTDMIEQFWGYTRVIDSTGLVL